MSDQNNTDPLKDLELAFLPSWAQEPKDAKPYADYSSRDKSRSRGRGNWGDSPQRRDSNRDFNRRGDRSNRKRDGEKRHGFQNRDGNEHRIERGIFAKMMPLLAPR